MYRKTSEEMLNFIKNNPTAFHVVEAIKDTLSNNGFQELIESSEWNLETGKSYFVSRNGSSIIAFKVGKEIGKFGFNIVSSHTDSPMFKIKEKSELHTGSKYTRLNTEGYGGMICSSWMDRPLSIAGRVILEENDGKIASKLVDLKRDLVLIPNVAIHMNREVNDKNALNKQIDMMPLFAAGSEEGSFIKLVAEELGVNENKILGSDLYLYSKTEPSIWGKDEEFISSGRLDDQQCVYSSMRALLESENNNTINVLACFDNEEVGSGTKQGADSTFLYDVLKRVSTALGMDENEYLRAIASSFMLSADNAHAVHPNHPEYTDAENCTYMNEGVVVKSHAGQKYTSDGMSIAIVKTLAKKAEVPLQYFSNRSDKAGGSTLGNIAMSHVSMNCADIGVPQLAMHSAYETAGIKDTYYMIQLMKQLYLSCIKETDAGMVEILSDEEDKNERKSK